MEKKKKRRVGICLASGGQKGRQVYRQQSAQTRKFFRLLVTVKCAKNEAATETLPVRIIIAQNRAQCHEKVTKHKTTEGERGRERQRATDGTE